MGPLLLIDVPNLAAKYFYARPAEVNPANGERVEVIYCVVVAIDQLRRQFKGCNVVLAFDNGRSKRSEVLACYKAKRQEDRDSYINPARDYRQLKRQLISLREYRLPELGYVNVCHCEGYEADDIIAAMAKTYLKPTLVVSGDKDFYQLLECPHVRVYNHTKKATYDRQDFDTEWGFLPRFWTRFKCMTGCSSDGIPGVPGVGDKLAARYIRGELANTHPAYGKIEAARETIIKRNLPLIKLPYEGTPVFPVKRQPPITERAAKEFFKGIGQTMPRDFNNG